MRAIHGPWSVDFHRFDGLAQGDLLDEARGSRTCRGPGPPAIEHRLPPLGAELDAAALLRAQCVFDGEFSSSVPMDARSRVRDDLVLVEFFAVMDRFKKKHRPRLQEVREALLERFGRSVGKATITRHLQRALNMGYRFGPTDRHSFGHSGDFSRRSGWLHDEEGDDDPT
jgi:hypothetical protein